MKRETIMTILVWFVITLIVWAIVGNNNQINELEKKIEILEQEKMK